MIKTVLLLTALALVQARPEDFEQINARLYEPHPNCPTAEVHFLLPHEYDCTKFYYCEYGLKYIEPRDCAPGTEFNAEIQVCVHPVSSGCTLPGYNTTPAPIAPTTAAPITAAPTTAAPATAAPTTAAPVTVAPTTAAPATAAPTTAAPATDAPSTAAPTTAAPVTVAPTTAAPVTVAPTTAAPSTAAPTTAAPVTVAPTTAAPVTVAPTTAAPVTDLPSTAASTLAPSPATTQAPITDAPTTLGSTWPATITQGPTTSEIPAPSTSAPATTANPDDCELLDNGCPADFDIHKLLPHEEYCHKFYQCASGELVLKYCPAGTYFNPELEICDWPHNVDCVNDGSYEYPTTSAPEVNPTTPGGDDIGDILDNGCPADFAVDHLLPHETECDKFYYCVFGEKIERGCAPGTYFNYEIQNCDWPENVDCVSSGTTSGPVGPTGVPEESDELPLPSDPEDDDWVPLPNGCPANFEIDHLLPHESDCNKFYYCVHGEIVETACPAGTHFNPVKQICDWPQYAGCEHWNGGCSGAGDDSCDATTAGPGNDITTAGPGNDGTTAESGNDGTTAGPGNDVTTAGPGNDVTTAGPVNDGTTAGSSNDGTTSGPVNDGTTAGPGNDVTTAGPVNDGTTAGSSNDGTTSGPVNDGTTAGPAPANKCQDTCNVAPWAHDTDCDKYWICNGDQPLLITCSEGLHFNPITNTCDFICNSGCVREFVQATAQYDGVSVFLPWDKVDKDMMKMLELD